MASPLSKVVFNSFEQLLSADVNRLQNVASREVQNLFKTMFSDGQVSYIPVDVSPVPISGLMDRPTLAFLSAFGMTLGAGSAFFFDATGVGADDSSYQVVRWAAQTVTFAAPDPTNPRIDLVVVPPTQVQSNSLVRNILTNPTTRTVVATAVFKDQNPASTAAILAGTPAASPIPPTTPAGSIVLFEVYVPAAAATASDFRPTFRTNRLAPTPISATHAILRGCALVWDSSAGDSKPKFQANTDNVAIIDGEAIGFESRSGLISTSITPSLVGDGNAANDPFTTAGPAGTARPYYVYLCGGRNMPQQSGAGGAGVPARAPVVLVASLVSPDVNGRPLASITTPRGALSTALLRRSALYVGVGFTRASSTSSIAMRMRGEWSTPNDDYLENVAFSLAAAGPGSQDVTFASLPSGFHSAQVRWQLNFAAPAATSERRVDLAQLLPGPALGTSQITCNDTILATTPATQTRFMNGGIDFPSSGNQVRILRTTTTELLTGSVFIAGYPHQAPRLDANAGLRGGENL